MTNLFLLFLLITCAVLPFIPVAESQAAEMRHKRINIVNLLSRYRPIPTVGKRLRQVAKSNLFLPKNYWRSLSG